MEKLYLRRTSESEHPSSPYVLTAESKKRTMLDSYGNNIYVMPLLVSGGFVIGIGRDNQISAPLAAASRESPCPNTSLSQVVYNVAVMFGEMIASTHPERLEFVDQTGGPKSLDFKIL